MLRDLAGDAPMAPAPAGVPVVDLAEDSDGPLPGASTPPDRERSPRGGGRPRDEGPADAPDYRGYLATLIRRDACARAAQARAELGPTQPGTADEVAALRQQS